MEENNTGFEEFADSFGVSGDYQTAAEETAQTENTTTEGDTASQEAAEAPTEEVSTDGEDTSDGEENSTPEASEPAASISEQKFAIKVDKETREVGIEELKEFAQKGVAFDRVKGQLTEARQTVQTMQAELDEAKKISDMVKRIAEDIKVSPEDLLKRVNVNWRMGKGETEKEALAHIEAAEAKRKLSEMTEKQKPAQETSQDRAKREVAEFREKYPDVEITPELMKAVAEDVRNGASLTDAYRKIEAEKKESEANALREQVAELQRQLAAEKQNKKNRATSPGSQKDSGGQRTKSEFDDFLSAFN